MQNNLLVRTIILNNLNPNSQTDTAVKLYKEIKRESDLWHFLADNTSQQIFDFVVATLVVPTNVYTVIEALRDIVTNINKDYLDNEFWLFSLPTKARFIDQEETWYTDNAQALLATWESVRYNLESLDTVDESICPRPANLTSNLDFLLPTKRRQIKVVDLTNRTEREIELILNLM